MLILLVDNNRFYISVLQQLIFRAGFHRVEITDSGLLCIKSLLEGNIPDVIIIDELQCQPDNLNVIENISISWPEITIIILTGTGRLVQPDYIAENEIILYMSKQSITAESLSEKLFDIYIKKLSSSKKSPVPQK
ncbi:MAG: response regulator [Bacteroidota bacterium]